MAALTTTSSGDDRLLTANADEEHFSELTRYQNKYRHSHHHHHHHQHQTAHHCHDNRAFQHPNNSNNKSGKSKNLDEDALDVIIIDPNDSRAKGLLGPGCFKLLPPKFLNGVGDTQWQQKRKPHLCKHEMRLRHNATQTPDSKLEYWVKIDPDIEPICQCVFHQKQIIKNNKHCAQHNICCNKYYDRCQHQHQHQHQHHHHYHHGQHKHRQQKQNKIKQQLPTTPTTATNTTTKSSLESNRRLQQIAIEIDAATTTTMTEDMGSTATSNFTYKLATRNSAPPIIVSNLRRNSLQSNATACTDELSNDDDDNEHAAAAANKEEEEIDVVGDEDEDNAHAPADDQIALTLLRRKSQRHRRHVSLEANNACINIKRKQFDLNDCYINDCSSCSSCSCCDLCQQNSSSCSSLELQQPEQVANSATKLTVMADCHYCSMHSNSSNDEPVMLRSKPTTAIKRTESFCSCNSERSCCSCCSCLQKDNEEASTSTATPQMCTALEFSQSSALDLGEDVTQTSRTLTPLSNDTAASTPIADDSEQQTLRSHLSRAAASLDDASESAEFYSLSSCAPSQLTPVHKSCRHHHHHTHCHTSDEKTTQTQTSTAAMNAYL